MVAIPENLTGRQLGDFQLVERIDEGGFGAVYLCEQPLLGREAVVKVLHQDLRALPSAQQRFLREAQLASLLTHPYAAHVYAFGVEESDGLFWIAMELVHGVTMRAHLDEFGPMPLDELVPFFEHVAEVVDAAHERGIVHRDIKPANIMLVEGRRGRCLPKLLDFGVAKLLGEVAAPRAIADGTPLETPRPGSARARLTSADTAIGSPPYMAPEQWSDALGVGPAADIYALGVVAYEALAGRRPFVAETALAYQELHRSAPVPPLGHGYSTRLDRVFARALAKRPEDRHASAAELAQALRIELDTRRRARRVAWARRIGVAAAVALVAGGLEYRSELHAEMADALVTQSEVEQGRQALLHDEGAEARYHLLEAWRRGDHEPGTAFMLARALQPQRAELARLPASSGTMWSAAFSPDGARIATTDDAAAQIWDAESRQLLFTLPHGALVARAVWSADGKALVTTCDDGHVRIWDAGTGTLRRELSPENGARPRYYLVALSPDGKLVASIDDAGAVAHAWSAETGAQLAELPADEAAFPSIAFSPDSRWLAVGGGDRVRVTETGSWSDALALAGPHIRGMAWSPDSRQLVTGSADGDASIWDVPSGARARHLREVGTPIDKIAISPNGQLVVTASRDGAVQVWDAATGALRSQSNTLRTRVMAVEFDPGSGLIAAGADTGVVAVTEAESGATVTVLDGALGAIRTTRWDRAGRRLIAASKDGTARVLAATSTYRQWASMPLAAECGVGTSVVPDGRFIAIDCGDQATRAWDTARDRLLATLPPVTDVEGDFAGARPTVTAEGDLAAIARGNVVEIYALPGGQLVRTVTHRAAVSSVAFAPGGRDLVTGDVAGQLIVTRESGDSAPPRAAGGIDAAVLLADGRVAATDSGRRMRVYAATGAVLAEVELPMRAGSLRPSPDGSRIVTVPYGADGGPAGLWEVAGLRPIARLGTPGVRVFSARFVDGGDVLTGAGDGVVRRWDGATGTLVQTYRGMTRFVADAALTPDGAMVIGGGAEGVLQFWDASSGRMLWKLHAHRSHVIGIHFEGEDIVTRGFGGDVARWRLPTPAQTFACSDCGPLIAATLGSQ